MLVSSIEIDINPSSGFATNNVSCKISVLLKFGIIGEVLLFLSFKLLIDKYLSFSSDELNKLTGVGLVILKLSKLKESIL